MAGIMAVAFVVALALMPHGRAADTAPEAAPAQQAA